HTPGKHVLWGVAAACLQGDFGLPGFPVVAALGFTLWLRGSRELTPDDFRTLLSADHFADDLDRILAGSMTLRQRFQRVAVTGFMVLRNPLGRQRRVGGKSWTAWKLFDQLRDLAPDFVLLRQAEREVRDELCDADAALAYVQRLPHLTVRCRWLAEPSPFTRSWTQQIVVAPTPLTNPDDDLRRLHAALLGDGNGDAR